MNESKKSTSELLEVHSDPAVLFDRLEKSIRQDAFLCSNQCTTNAEISVMVGNVLTVSQFCKNSTARNIELFKANLKHDSIMYMSACKLQYKMVSESIHYRVDFA